MCGFTSAHIYHIIKLLESQITATAQTSPSPLLYMQNETSNLIHLHLGALHLKSDSEGQKSSLSPTKDQI